MKRPKGYTWAEAQALAREHLRAIGIQSQIEKRTALLDDNENWREKDDPLRDEPNWVFYAEGVEVRVGAITGAVRYGSN